MRFAHFIENVPAFPRPYNDPPPKSVQAVEEKAILSEQLEAERELCQEAEEMRQRLQTKKNELEELLNELEARIDDEEEKTISMAEERKKLQKDIQDLEDRCVQSGGLLYTY